MIHHVIEVSYSVGGLALFFEICSEVSEGKMCFKLGIVALLFSCVNREMEECGSEIQLLLE